MIAAAKRAARVATRLPAVHRLALAAAAACLFVAACGRGKTAPDVLLVTLDTTRADHIGCYGASFAQTPNLDALAREGYLFEHAVTPVPMTLPSHTTILTGMLPPRHGVRNNGAYHLPTDAETIAERFAAAGYETGAFVSAFVLDRQFGLGQGFAAYDDSLYNERRSADTVTRAARWLNRRAPERPVFLWVHLYDAHAPWTPAPPFSRLPVPTLYDREIAADDHALGQVIDAFKKSKRWNRTIVAVLADHGEGLGDHGEVEHGIFLYQETTRVPFVLRVPPKVMPRLKAVGAKVKALISTVDVAPTLLELAGLKPFAEIDGKSVVPLLAQSAGEDASLDRHGVYLETLYPKENFGWAPLFAFQTEDWKYVRAPQRELYQLEQDPGEKMNRAESDTAQAATLDRRLSRQIQAMPTPAAPSNVSPEVEERLRSLGYLSGGSLTAGSEVDLPDPKELIASHGDFDEAKRAMDDQRFPDAVAPFRRVLARESGNLVATLGLGIALVKTSAFAEAEKVLRRAIELSPQNATAQSALADALFGQERWSDAFELYRLAARDRTNARHTETRIALCLLMLKRDADLATLFQNASTRPNDRVYFADLSKRIDAWRGVANASGPDSLALSRARAAAAAGLAPIAGRILKTPLRDARAEANRLSLLATFYSETGQPAAALVLLDQLATRATLNREQAIARAGLLLAVDRPGDALAAYDAVPGELAPRARALIDYNRACALARLGKTDEALGALELAVSSGYDALGTLYNDADLAPLRGEERFQALLDRLETKPEATKP